MYNQPQSSQMAHRQPINTLTATMHLKTCGISEMLFSTGSNDQSTKQAAQQPNTATASIQTNQYAATMIPFLILRNIISLLTIFFSHDNYTLLPSCVNKKGGRSLLMLATARHQNVAHFFFAVCVFSCSACPSAIFTPIFFES